MEPDSSRACAHPDRPFPPVAPLIRIAPRDDQIRRRTRTREPTRSLPSREMKSARPFFFRSIRAEKRRTAIGQYIYYTNTLTVAVRTRGIYRAGAGALARARTLARSVCARARTCDLIDRVQQVDQGGEGGIGTRQLLLCGGGVVWARARARANRVRATADGRGGVGRGNQDLFALVAGGGAPAQARGLHVRRDGSLVLSG